MSCSIMQNVYPFSLFNFRMCDPVIVLSEGSVLFEGTSEEVKNNELVIESYLGRSNKQN